jgi:alpha-aminoadipate carrier protein LysW
MNLGAATAIAQNAVQCTECGGSVSVPHDVMIGEILSCPDCGAELEVQTVEPSVTVALAPDVQEDWGE